MVVIGCYGAVFSMLLFLFGVNSVLIKLLCSVFSALQRNTSRVSELLFACIIYMIL